jgi:AraC-like DNA-binding protein
MRNMTFSEKIVDFILSLEIEELANLNEQRITELFDVKISYLYRKYKKEQEMTLQQFILRHKLQCAMFMLSRGEKFCVEEMSLKLGFQNTETFVNEFSDYFAVEPERYQEIKGLRMKAQQ